MPNFFKKKIQIISMDSRQKKICQIIHKFFTKFKIIYKIYTKLLQPEVAAPRTPVHTRPQAKRNDADLSRRKNEGSSASAPLLVNRRGPPRAVPLSFAHVHTALLGGGHAA